LHFSKNTPKKHKLSTNSEIKKFFYSRKFLGLDLHPPPGSSSSSTKNIFHPIFQQFKKITNNSRKTNKHPER
jgi:hypothetical protein